MRGRTLCLALLLPAIGNAGDLTGTYRVAGELPADAVDSSSLVVDAQSGGLVNVIVYLKKSPDGPHKPNRPDPEVLVREGDYLPRVLTVMAGETVMIKSDDGSLFSPRLALINNNPNCYAPTPGPDGELPVPLEKPERLPIPVRCDIDPNRKGYWLIVDHPYAAVTDSSGSFTVKDLPPGEHELTVWHERIGYVERNVVVSIREGENVTRSTVDIPAERFRPDKPR